MSLTKPQKITFPAILKGKRPRLLSHDFETFCEVNVTDVGADAYSRHPSCEILMCGYAFDDDPVKQWVPEEGERMPSDLEDALLDDRVLKTCWNKSFECSIWQNVAGIHIPHNQWRDTQALAYSLALPGSLEKAGQVVGLGAESAKFSDGRALIRTFSVPRKPSKTKPWTRTRWYMEPEKWDRFLAYNRQDVEAERAILRKLRRFDMPEHEWELWVIDQIINERGIPLNMRAVDSAVRLYEHLIDKKIKRMREITGLQNPNSGQQLLPWLKDHGYVFDDLKKGHIERATERVSAEIETAQPGENIQRKKALKEVLILRMDASRSSPKKFYAIQRCADRVSGVLRNTFQFAGAGRTWRWAGRTLQPQNLPRPEKAFEKIIEMVVKHLEDLDPEAIELIYEDPMDLLVSCIRSVVQPGDGFLLYDADLNAIENRGLGWCALDRKILRVFELNRDPYIDFATYLFHQPYDVLWTEYKEHGKKDKRTVAKPGVLGCGYRLGPGEQHINRKTGEMEATGLLGYAHNMGVKLTPEQAKLSVDTFRETFRDVVQFWYDIEKAAMRCIKTGKPTVCNMLRFEMSSPFLRMILPSNRALSYCRPRVEPVLAPWGEMKDSVTYEGLNDQNQWVRISTHGGKLTENAVQAISRDVIATGLRRAYYRGLDIRIHVHDQIIGVAPEDEAEEHLSILQECMSEEEDWHFYGGVQLPLASAGFVSKVFKKD